MILIESLVTDETVCKGSKYDVAEVLEDGLIYIWDNCGEYYLMYPDEYKEVE